ncbi:MAG: tRNA (adenosine(37)-N6)-threonylcarbamoyltransferase complex ATPase subunit type 1 TsaE [Actinomycetota bacterium]|nr:tRNA (adenosine(37)-N6)-threonylcarbamoyltransferase complex ATPase subunit type 1 TsaE [Actinomycetota bacterium]MDP2287890.1 tRNA (adenosine(37)-N6)-threonylcarbamoyltransferase complex ATPase subunit type 1 TsaE [Actinomycetota bacterium]
MIEVATGERMFDLGKSVATHLQPGDLLVLIGELGAGKTTFVQGLGRGLGVSERVTSPTFVIARSHEGSVLPLVHVDAYRLGSAVELEIMDLDLIGSVVAVEWGEGKTESLAENRLIVRIQRSHTEDETRRVDFVGVGPRWTSAAVEELTSQW